MKATFRPRALLGATLLALWAGSASGQRAEDLLEIYRLAADNDAVIRQARAQYSATHLNVNEALANWLPTVTLQGQSARNTQAPTVSHSLSEGFNTHSYSLNLTQNLLNFEAWYSFQSVRENDRQAMTNLAQAEQQLILRVAAAYFDVLRSQNNLVLFEAEENAAREVMNQSQERYDLGFGQISDVFDAQAAHARARVSRMDEANLLRQRIQTLEIITGGNHSILETLNENFPVVSADPHSIDEWVQRTLQNNLAIKAAEFTLASTEFQAKAAKSAMLPTLTINGNYNDTAERDNPFAFISQASNSSAIGVTLSMPLFRGGANRARLQRAYYTIDANKEALSQVERENTALTRNSFNNIETALETVAARLETIQFAERALEATEVGIEVGTRNIVDLMQAQRILFQARRDYANARFDYIINTLTLKQAAGILSPQDVIDLNEWLR